MKNFYYLNHPKKGKLYDVPKRKSLLAQKYFENVDTVETISIVNGKEYKTIVDYKALLQLGNIDCFNCANTCCHTNPVIFEKHTREFIIENYDKFNELTLLEDILLDMDYSKEEILKFYNEEDALVPNKVKREITYCTCAFKKDNKSVLCSLHAIGLEKGLSLEEIIRVKPLICTLSPIEVFSNDELDTLFITVSNENNVNFIVEDNYTVYPCLNKELACSSLHKRDNPEGFNKEDFTPMILQYSEYMRCVFGNKLVDDIINKMSKDKLINIEDYNKMLNKQQIMKTIE